MLQHAGIGWLNAQTLMPAVAGLLGVAVGGWMQGCAARDSRFALLAKTAGGALGTYREFLKGELYGRVRRGLA